MPEEINRIATDRISDLLFAPTKTALINLRNEGLSDISYYSGDVMYDSVLYYKQRILNYNFHFQGNSLPSDFFLATIHRAENTDNIDNLKDIFYAFSKIDFPIVIPLHPRTKNILKKIINIPNNVTFIEPVSYLNMLYLILNSEKVLTDSGGLQKEAYFLDKPCITLRNETEWIETLQDNWNVIAGVRPDSILEAVGLTKPKTRNISEFGDGNAAKIIITELLTVFEQGNT